MKKEISIFLEHILESIDKIEEYTKDITKEKLIEDTKAQDAIVRRIEIIGEAIKNIPEDFKNKYSDIEWSKIVRTRDKIIHHYFGVDLNIIWDIVNKDIKMLKKKILEIKRSLGENEN